MNTKFNRGIETNLRWHALKAADYEDQGMSRLEAHEKALKWLMAYRAGQQWAVNEAPEPLIGLKAVQS